MLKWIRKHDKKILAVFMVGLMIQFLASSRPSGSSNGANKAVIGQIGGADVYNTELSQSEQEWRFLNEYLGKLTEEGFFPIARLMYSPKIAEEIIVRHPELLIFAPQTALEIRDHPEVFMLLRHEARNSGVRINPDDVASIKANYYMKPTGDDADVLTDIVDDGINDLLLIQANFDRVASDVKISQPLLDQTLAKVLQQIVLSTVEFPSTDFLTKTAAPTTQQAQAQFDKYSATPPGQPTAANPMGFGYYLPERVKLQYFKIGRDEAEKTIDAQKSPYDWDVAARLYYLQHPDQFATTQPSDQVAATLPSTSQPAAKPYDQVRDQALHAVRDPLVDKLLLDVQSKILTTLSADWHTYVQNGGNGDYPSYSYLVSLAESVQAHFGMKVYATELNRDYLSADDLADLPAIGQSSDGQTDFADYVIQLANQYLSPPDATTQPTRAQLMQPAAPMRDRLGNDYIFRLTDARPAEAPADLAAVASKVDTDLRAQAAFELARSAASALQTAAQKTSLEAVAKAAGRTLVQTDPFNSDSSDLGVSITLTPAGRTQFIDRAFKLLSEYDPTTDPHPIELIDVPFDGKVFVARLEKVDTTWTPESFFYRSSAEATAILIEQQMRLRLQWLDYQAVVNRLGYKPQASKS